MLKAIYKSGSKCILGEGRDDDYVYYYENNEERIKALQENTNHEIDIHFADWSKEPKITTYTYIYHYCEFVEGEHHTAVENCSIFDEEVKKKYVPLLLTFTERLRDDDKKWYHILTAVYLYEAGEYSLTKTQLKKIKKVHDNGVDNAIKNYCIEALNKLK